MVTSPLLLLTCNSKVFNDGEFLIFRSKEFQSLIVDGRNEFVYNTVQAFGTIKSFLFGTGCLDMFCILCGISNRKYCGISSFIILYNWNI